MRAFSNKHYGGEAQQARATIKGVRAEFEALVIQYREVHRKAVTLAEEAMKARDQGTSNPYRKLEELVALLRGA